MILKYSKPCLQNKFLMLRFNDFLEMSLCMYWYIMKMCMIIGFRIDF